MIIQRVTARGPYTIKDRYERNFSDNNNSNSNKNKDKINISTDSDSAGYSKRESVANRGGAPSAGVAGVAGDADEGDMSIYETKHVSDRESDPHRLQQRRKQIDYGKVYGMYLHTYI